MTHHRIGRGLTAGLVVSLATAFLCCHVTKAQENAPSAVAPTSRGDDSGLVVVSAGPPIGSRVYAPGHWGLVRILARNDGDDDGTVQVSVMTKDAPDLRYSKNVWIPSHATRETWVPLFIPARENEQQANSSLPSLTSAQPATAPADLTNKSEPMETREVISRVESGGSALSEDNGYLIRLAPRGATVYVDDREERVLAPQEKYPPYEAALAMRQSRGLNRTMSLINERFLPAMVENWDAVENVIIVGNRLTDDTAGLASLRQWVASGGRVWIQLNTVRDELPRKLLGGAFQLELVDRVKLDEFAIKLVGAGTETVPFERHLEEPAELMRVMVDGARVLYEIDGWPAAFVVPYGHGEVLITTLGASGWIRPHAAGDPPFADPLAYTDFMPIDPLKDLAAHFMRPRNVVTVAEDKQAEYVTDRIGYEVPSRGFIFTILLGFCAAIVILGMLLHWTSRLEHLSWLTLTLGMAGAAVIVSAGWSSRQSVPPTASSQLVVRAIPATGEYSAVGTVAIYQPDQTKANLGSNIGTRINPDLVKLRGQIRKVVWDDVGSWSWNDTSMPPGVHVVEIAHSGRLTQPLAARASLTTAGLTGSIRTIAHDEPEVDKPDRGFAELNFEDGIIVFPNGPPMAANLNPDGSFVAGLDDQLAEGQFFKDSLLSDEQRRRMLVYQSWLESHLASDRAETLLIAWCDNFTQLIEWPDSVSQTGAAMVVIPLDIEPSAPSSAIAIPNSLVRARTRLSEFGQSAAYNNQTESWSNPNTSASVSRLRFQVPHVALPMELTDVNLTIDCNMPSRELEIYVVDGETRKLLETISNPSGKIRYQWTAEDGLRLDAQGGVTFDFAVSDLKRDVEQATIANSGWIMRSTRLDVRGNTVGNEGTANHE